MIKLEAVSKGFSPERQVLKDANLEVTKGEWVWVVGATGVGKSVLVKLVSGELLPSGGIVRVLDKEVPLLNEKELSALRRRMGIVFQDVRLLDERTVFENVYLMLEALGVAPQEAGEKATGWLDRVGMVEFRESCPYQLSIGQRQKVALARALSKEPELLLLDEPLSALDEAQKRKMLKLLGEVNHQGTTILAASHEHEVLHFLPGRVLELTEKGLG